MTPTITVDQSALGYVLERFGKTVDSDGYIVEQGTGDMVYARDGRPIQASDLGAVVNAGTDTGFVRNNIVDMIQHVEATSNE